MDGETTWEYVAIISLIILVSISIVIAIVMSSIMSNKTGVDTELKGEIDFLKKLSSSETCKCEVPK
jgi:uncharacterized membrane-anchored protein YhcB (DUF1043 family)